MAVTDPLVPVILSGGAGTRLWPLSRELYPKQLLPLLSDVSLLQETVLRSHGERFHQPLLVCSAEHRFVIAEQLRVIGIRPKAIVLEPVARNTAPSVAAAALILAARDPNTLMLVLPSDHMIDDSAAFHEAVDAAAAVARRGYLVTFGVTPDRPETGYGYIKQGEPLDASGENFAIERFVEKPDLPTAERYLSEGEWLWNSGMFVFPAQLFLDELARFEPEMLKAVRESVRRSHLDLEFVRLAEDEFPHAPAKSVDYAVMERTDRAAVVPIKLGWSDVGTYSALWEMGTQDASGNVVLGDVISHDSSGCYLRGDGVLVATLGLTDSVVVATGDVVLVADKHRAQDVKALVDLLRAGGRPEALSHKTVFRPWGHYQSIDVGPAYQVKHITVKPGHKLSLQKHAHRAEHWVIVSGVAEVTRGDEVIRMGERMSLDVPVGCVHRLANPGPDMLHLIEVQTGDYLGEDDIVRLDDVYGR
jgi:mannose-1-phosphate guanylyltransferase/mannose-6-phosphate isomerase